MDMFVVHGGRRLRGRVRVSGSKNAALPIMAATLLTEGPTVLHGVPELVDVTTLGQLLTSLGVDVRRVSHDSAGAEIGIEPSEATDEESTVDDATGEPTAHAAVPYPFGVSLDGIEGDVGDPLESPAPLR